MKRRVLIALLLVGAMSSQLFPASVFIDSFRLVSAILSKTNVQKLSLDPATPLATVVAVSDGFYVSEFGDARDGFYTYRGLSDSSKPFYNRVDQPNNQYNGYVVFYASGQWQYNGDEGSDAADTGDEDYPWQAAWATPTLTHPATQALAAASSSQAGVFVSGHGVYIPSEDQNAHAAFTLLGNAAGGDFDIKWGNANQWDDPGWKVDTFYSLSPVITPDLAGTDKFTMAIDGIAYSKRGTSAGKSYYNKIGVADSTSLDTIVWSGSEWRYIDSSGLTLDASTSAVATPDLATFLLGTVVTNTAWLNASDDTPASIAVSSVTSGRIGAGVKCDGLTFQNQGAAFDGRMVYACLSSSLYLVHFNNKWNKSTTADDSGIMATSDANALAPDLTAWTGAGLSVSISNVANESNWVPSP